MAMRLLAKSEIDKAKAVEKKREVDEGMKLARRVDNLREIAAQEEASLLKFRQQTVATIHDEIITEQSKLDLLKAEVGSLAEQKVILQKPLDEEWQKLKQDREEFDAKADLLFHRENAVSLREKSVQEDKRESEALLANARHAENLTHELACQAIENKKLTEKELATAVAIVERTQKFVASKKEELTHMDMVVRQREVSATIREKALVDREKALDIRNLQLLDREAMLERDFKRINKTQ